MKAWMLAATAAVVIAAPVQAADIPVKARPAPVAAFSWIGCYLGVNGGWMGSDSHVRTELSGAFLLPGNIFRVPPARGSLDRDLGDFGSTGTVGATFGCNLTQYGNWLFGIESDFNWAGRRTITAAFGITDVPGQGAQDASSSTHRVSTEMFYSTFRSRAGFTAGQWYVYGTGGTALAWIRSTTNITYAADAFFLNSTAFNATETRGKFGWTAGGGVEYAFGNWSFKAEYLYLDFGHFRYSSPCTGAICGAGGGGFSTDTVLKLREHVARVGLNYRFGGLLVARD